ncbi:MAG TPA: hypothetical protein VJJ83_02610 [Candidatus Babeliales bacterium]|nr:hypothetical protein [Candidatus Babeliales bacterium]
MLLGKRLIVLGVGVVIQVESRQTVNYHNTAHQNLYGILSDRGNLKLTSVWSILHVLGLKLTVQPDVPNKHK